MVFASVATASLVPGLLLSLRAVPPLCGIGGIGTACTTPVDAIGFRDRRAATPVFD
jgi:hypothetical protein